MIGGPVGIMRCHVYWLENVFMATESINFVSRQISVLDSLL